MKKYMLCFIGSGAACHFVINNIIKQNFPLINDTVIHIFEKNIHPYGLIRSGIAPDHQYMKTSLQSMINNNLKTYKNNIHFFGNCPITNITPLLNIYSAIFISNGAQHDNKLHITPNINSLSHIYSSSKVTSWYNCDINTTNTIHTNNNSSSNIVIIGNGNVALDIARVLAIKRLKYLKHLDISEERLVDMNKIKKNIRNVFIVGRRGIEHSAFNVHQLREFKKSVIDNGWNIHINNNDIKCISQLTKSRKLNLLKSNVNTFDLYQYNTFNKTHLHTSNNVYFLYNYTPNTITYNKILRCNVIKFINKHNHNNIIEIPTNMIITSIGRNTINNIPQYNNNINNDSSNSNNKYQNIFKVGWCNTNAKGNITSTLSDANNTYYKFISHINLHKVNKRTFITPTEILYHLGISNRTIISYKEWNVIDRTELTEGKALNKLREKIISKSKMLSLV